MQSGYNTDGSLKHDDYLSVVSSLIKIKPVPSQQIDSFDGFMDGLPHLFSEMTPVVWRRNTTLIVLHFGKLQILPPQKPLKGRAEVNPKAGMRSQAAINMLRAIRHYEDTTQGLIIPDDAWNIYGINTPLCDDNCDLWDQNKSHLREERRSLNQLKQWIDTALLPHQAEREGWSYCATGWHCVKKMMPTVFWWRTFAGSLYTFLTTIRRAPSRKRVASKIPLSAKYPSW